MDYLEFTRWINAKEPSIVIPAECTVLVPPTSYPRSSVVWTFTWVLLFKPDNKYLRIWEHHDKVAGLIGTCRRLQFAFHYGAVTQFDTSGVPEVDEFGVPLYMASDPVDIRIDNSCPGRKPHLHYGAPNPHYQQEQVSGLDLNALDMFSFVSAILEHRESAKPIQRTLKFHLP